MKEVPRCSVVIPAYKCERYIADCLSSVQAQTLKEIEILVIDDRSPDKTAEIVKTHAEEDRRIRHIKQDQNQGVAAARNRGVREARSEWVAFLDSDDAWLSGKLEKQFSWQKECGAEMIYTAAQCMDSLGNMTDRSFRVPARIDYDTLLKGNDIVCSSVLVKREWLLKYPMERSDLHEDYLCWLRLLKNGCKAMGIDEPLTHYRLTEGSKSRNKGKSARMTWETYGQLGLPFFRRCVSFMGYALHGIRRYSG